MVKENIAVAKARLSRLVNAALEGEDVVICKDGRPVVRLVPVQPPSAEDPCRPIPELTIRVGDEALAPLDPEDWEDLLG